MKKYGTNYGGYVFPSNLQLNKESKIYCFGVGEDISFDVEIAKATGANIHLFDFTPRAIEHVKLIQDVYDGKQTIQPNSRFGGGDKSYTQRILTNKIKSSQLILHPYGLGTADTEVEMYYPENPEHVSLSINPKNKSKETMMVPVKSLQTIMKELNHTKIDLLKLDIECLELEVLDSLIKSNIRPRYLAVDFDSARIGNHLEAELIIQRLCRVGYRLFWFDSWDATLVFG